MMLRLFRSVIALSIVPLFLAVTCIVNAEEADGAAASSTTGCASNCFASVGAGVVLSPTKWGDYNNSSNILQSTHVGSSTPQYSVGLAYKLSFREGFIKRSKPCSDTTSPFCYPYKAFVSLKFSPDSSQTFSGFTYGLTHALCSNLDLVAGISYSANNEISPGFQRAALNVVKAQQTAGNPYYAQFNLASLQANGPTAYDGFPIQLMNSDGTTGSIIYAGSPTVLHYHTGFFMGIAVPITFKGLLSGK
jgi:hypothetical protein